MSVYADVIDPQLIQSNIDADYTNESRLIYSGIGVTEGVPDESTAVEWIKTKMFAGQSAQAVGIGTEISLNSKVQTGYKMPIAKRGNGGEIDQTLEEIRSKAQRLNWTQREVQENVNISLTAALQTNAADGLDNMCVSVIDGVAAYCKTNSVNYNDRSGNQIALTDYTTAMALRGEGGLRFSRDGYVMMDGAMYQKHIATGLVAFTSNTVGIRMQDQIVSSGVIPTILGMTPFVTDKISAPDSGDKKIILIEKGALRIKSGAITIHSPQKVARRDAYIMEYYFRAGAIVDGFSWSASKDDIVTDAELATGTNYTVFVESAKNLPVAFVEVDA